MKEVFITVWIGISLLVTLLAWSRKNKKFYTNTFHLGGMGIYVWGDALILAPFWIISGLLWYFLSTTQVFQYISIFFLCRSFFEVIYWLLFQFHNNNHTEAPDLHGLLKNFTGDQKAILYQVTHMCVVVVMIALLFWSL